jgi:hypothetical protein
MPNYNYHYILLPDFSVKKVSEEEFDKWERSGQKEKIETLRKDNIEEIYYITTYFTGQHPYNYLSAAGYAEDSWNPTLFETLIIDRYKEGEGKIRSQTYSTYKQTMIGHDFYIKKCTDELKILRQIHGRERK